MKHVPIVTMVAAAFAGNIAGAQEDAAQSEQTREMKLRAESFELFLPDDNDDRQPRAAQLSSEPLLAYSDPARVFQQSGLWLWNDDGRPVALLAIEFYPRLLQAGQVQPDVWTFEAATFRQTSSRVKFADARWDLRHGSGMELEIAPAPDPHEDRTVRLRQMKQLARQFRAETSSEDEGEIALRLLPNPLYRYAESVEAVLDGALFAFVYGTNPELICVIEAVVDEDARRWKCGFAPLTASALRVEWRDREVWSADDYSGPGTRENYVNGRVPETNEQSERSQ